MTIECSDRIRFLDEDGEAGITIDAETGEVEFREGLSPTEAASQFWREVHAVRGDEVTLSEIAQAFFDDVRTALALGIHASAKDIVAEIARLRAGPPKVLVAPPTKPATNGVHHRGGASQTNTNGMNATRTKGTNRR